MEIRQYARDVLAATTLEGKLAPVPDDWTDAAPGAPQRWEWPARPPELAIVDAKAVKVPRPAGMRDPEQRPRILHALCNHELQAVELFAWALLAFPDAPPAFRRGLVAIMAEERAHFLLYAARAEAHGVRFGDLPVTGHFWHKLAAVRTPAEFVCAVGLTFESANLDFAREYAAHARAVGDEDTARAIERVHADEIRHVAFGWRWLARFKRADETMTDAYLARVAFPLGPARARGRVFDRAAREAAGLDAAFIELLERAPARRHRDE